MLRDTCCVLSRRKLGGTFFTVVAPGVLLVSRVIGLVIPKGLQKWGGEIKVMA